MASKKKKVTAKSPKKSSKPHRCIEQVNKALAPRGDQLQAVISLSGGPPSIYVATERKDSVNWKRGAWLQAIYCPFCGEKMPQ